MKQEDLKKSLCGFWEITKRNLKNRYLYIIIFSIVFIMFSVINKDLKYKTIYNPDASSQQSITNEKVSEDLKLSYDKPMRVIVNVGSNNKVKSNIYTINILRDDEVIASSEIDTYNLGEPSNIAIELPAIEYHKDEELTVDIQGNAETKEEGLILNTSNVGEHNMYVDGEKNDNSLFLSVVYPKYIGIYLEILLLLYIAGCIMILYINTSKIHNTVFAIIMIIGGFSVLLNPVLDTPDDNAHLARADLTSRGILFITGNIEDYKVSESIGDIVNDMYETLEDTDLFDSNMNLDNNFTSSNYANTNIFLSYIPQAMGILLSKILRINSMSILVLGKLFNLMFYAFMVRFAIKLTPMFKIPLSIISIMPMSIFIASSFNPDASTYSLAFVTIAYLLYLYKKEDIKVKEIAIFSILSILLGLVKLPFCVVGGLIIFLPKEKFIDNKTYWKSFLFVFLVAIVSIVWAGIAMITGAVSPFNYFYEMNNIDTKQQVMYILKSPLQFSKYFITNLYNNIGGMGGYLDQLSTFGWLTYKLNDGSLALYPIFIGIVLFAYPEREHLCKKTKYGVAIVSFASYAITCLILYLTWNSVGSTSLLGVQGRYFVPTLALLTLMTFGNKSQSEEENLKIDYKFMFISVLFSIIFIITILNKYY